MQLLTVLAWIAVIYCAGGILAVLMVALSAGNQTPSDDTGTSRRMLKVFAAWPVLAGHMIVVAMTTMAQKLRGGP